MEDTFSKIKKYLMKHGLADENTSVDTDTLHRLFDENKEVMDWLKDK